MPHTWTRRRAEEDSQEQIPRNEEAELHHRAGAIVATEPRHLSGVAVQMVRELCATLVVYVRIRETDSYARADHACRLRQADKKDGLETFGGLYQFASERGQSQLSLGSHQQIIISPIY